MEKYLEKNYGGWLLYFPRYYVTCRGSLPREKTHEKLARTRPAQGPRAGPLEVQTRTGSRGAAGGAARARP